MVNYCIEEIKLFLYTMDKNITSMEILVVIPFLLDKVKSDKKGFLSKGNFEW